MHFWMHCSYPWRTSWNPWSSVAPDRTLPERMSLRNSAEGRARAANPYLLENLWKRGALRLVPFPKGLLFALFLFTIRFS